MNRNREIIELTKEILLPLSYDDGDGEDYIYIENEIASADEEDGGAEHDLIIQRISDGKFFSLNYTDWDMSFNYNNKPSETMRLRECFPKTITKTIYV